MRFFIRIDQDNRIIMKVSASESLYDTVEISEEEYRGIDLNNYVYFYEQNKIIQGEQLEQPAHPLSHEETTLATYQNVELSSMDNLINMDMILELNEKLNKIMEHLGL